MSDSSAGQESQRDSLRSSILREYKELIFLALIVLIIVGVQRLPITKNSAKEAKLDKTAKILEELKERSRIRDQELEEIKSDLERKKSGRSPLGIRVGEAGILRMDIISKEEGKDLPTPSQVMEAITDQADKLKSRDSLKSIDQLQPSQSDGEVE